MGTEVALSFTALRAQLESEKSSLYKIDENIKKIVQTSGRFPNDRFNASGDYSRGGARLGGRNSFPDTGKSDDIFGKRKHETKTVFSRLSARHDSSGEEEGGAGKRARMPSAVSRELPTRAAVLRAQGGDEQARKRNRRIFGSLLGTLQKFKQEEIVLQTKEDKRAQVERKIEEQARLEKEQAQKERKTLFFERDQKKATIKALEAKVARVQEFERWEASQKHLGNFILTKAKPHLYWLPKKMTEKATEKLTTSRKFHEKCMSKKRQELVEELSRIEQRCLRRPPPPPANENEPVGALPDTSLDLSTAGAFADSSLDISAGDDSHPDGDKGKKRDKFAMDVDEKEESEGEEKHDDAAVTELAENDITTEENGEIKVNDNENISNGVEETQTSQDSSPKPTETQEESQTETDTQTAASQDQDNDEQHS